MNPRANFVRMQDSTHADRQSIGREFRHFADGLGTFHHPDIAAAILQPFVSGADHWMVQHHGIFQGHYFFHHIGLDRDLRDQFAAHPHYAHAGEFCELFDSPAFDPKAETLPLAEIMPMLRRLLAQPRRSIYRPGAPAHAP